MSVVLATFVFYLLIFGDDEEWLLMVFCRHIDAPHASFLHPDATATTQPRESIEVRALVFTSPGGKTSAKSIGSSISN